MSFLPRPFFLCLLSLIFLLISHSQSESDYTTLVYKGCAKQALQDPNGVYSQAVSSLFGSLIAQSSKSKFYKATAGSGQTTINGLFQCRGDLSNVDCYNCVSKLPILIDKLCGQQIAARVQLVGCYMLYEISGFTQVSGLEMLFKTCSGKNKEGSGFEEKRDTSLSQLENGVGGGNGNGFYTTNYESVYSLGQCEGDLGNADCGDCVKSAVQRVQVECGSSVSGMVFLDKCFVSYNYGSSGLPKGSGSSSGSDSGSGSGSGSSSYSGSDSSYSPSGSGHNTGKTVAIILGGAVGVGFLVILLLAVKNAMKKHDDY